MRKTVLGFFSLFLLSLLTAESLAQGRKEALVDKVKGSIGRGVDYLRRVQRKNDGSWDLHFSIPGFQGGESALALLAMLNCGVPVQDPAIQLGLKYLRGVDSNRTYIKALQTMALVEAGLSEDAQLIQENVRWLIEARVVQNGILHGWTYGKGPSNITDNSNSQYALLGLWAGKQYGVKINPDIWEQIRNFYMQTQSKDGSWSYAPYGGPADSRLTMTTAGLCGLLIAGMELNTGREKLNDNGPAEGCGVYQDNQPINRGLSWISNPLRDRLQIDLPQATFYNLYGIERTGRLSGLRFIGAHDWYREGCQYLVQIQGADGSWSSQGAHNQWPVISTSFSLLFLSKGRTPVLISKLVHTDRVPRSDDDTDWNNDRNDLRHLVDYAGKELFKKLPLAWQTFDMMRAATPRPGSDGLTEDDLLDVTSDLLQAPILYFNGHKSPRFRFTNIEKKLLQTYVENGGFLVVEACCGSQAFDQGFKDLARDLWPDDPLVELEANHPVWSSFSPVAPGQPFRLMGINMGCKTVLIYSPQDLSCQWENNNTRTATGLTAFKLGANIVAYATGMEPPRPRLTQVELASAKDDPRIIPRGYFKAAQLKHRGDWQPAPKAMRNLMSHLRNKAGLDVALKTEELQIGNKSLVDFKFLYVHGRGEFSFTEDQLKTLRFNLENGGLLFADAACGKPIFDKAFRKFAQVLFPDHKLQEVPLDDALFGKELNGEVLNEQTIKCRREAGGQMRPVPPFLEGIKIDNRWVLLYSKYDIGCALEHNRASDCLGYDPDSAFKIAGAAALYLLNLRN